LFVSPGRKGVLKRGWRFAKSLLQHTRKTKKGRKGERRSNDLAHGSRHVKGRIAKFVGKGKTFSRRG